MGNSFSRGSVTVTPEGFMRTSGSNLVHLRAGCTPSRTPSRGFVHLRGRFFALRTLRTFVPARIFVRTFDPPSNSVVRVAYLRTRCVPTCVPSRSVFACVVCVASTRAHISRTFVLCFIQRTTALTRIRILLSKLMNRFGLDPSKNVQLRKAEHTSQTTTKVERVSAARSWLSIDHRRAYLSFSSSSQSPSLGGTQTVTS